jgi:hypothetical protein
VPGWTPPIPPVAATATPARAAAQIVVETVVAPSPTQRPSAGPARDLRDALWVAESLELSA